MPVISAFQFSGSEGEGLEFQVILCYVVFKASLRSN